MPYRLKCVIPRGPQRPQSAAQAETLVYQWAEQWGRYLWRLRHEFDQAIADTLIAYSIFFLTRWSTFEQGVLAICLADSLANGTGFEPFEETLALPIEEFNVEAKEQIIADQRKVVLALRPVAEGKYQMMRRKADVKLSNDVATNGLRLRQIALKVQFETPNQPTAVAAYPITKDSEFKESDLKDGQGWTLLKAR